MIGLGDRGRRALEMTRKLRGGGVGVPGERRLDDGAMLGGDIACRRVDGEGELTIALALLVEAVAEAHQPDQPAGADESGMEPAVPDRPHLRVAGAGPWCRAPARP